jgi:hypothetical protein
MLASWPWQVVFVAREIKEGNGVRFGRSEVGTAWFNVASFEGSQWDETAATLARDLKAVSHLAEMALRSAARPSPLCANWACLANSYINAIHRSVHERDASHVPLPPRGHYRGSPSALLWAVLGDVSDKARLAFLSKETAVTASETKPVTETRLGTGLTLSPKARAELLAESMLGAVQEMENALLSAFGSGVRAELTYREDPEIPFRARFVVTISAEGQISETLAREVILKRVLRSQLDRKLLERLCFVYGP